MNNKYSVIVFDLGNVLIPFDYDVAINKINKIEDGLGDHFMKYYRENYHIHREFESGKIPEDKFIEMMLKVLKYKIDAETFCKYYSEIFSVNLDVVNLLPLLKKKYKLVMLSNTNSIHKKYGWEKYDFIDHFEKLILSHEVKAVKPEPEIYKAVEDYTGENPTGHFYIDDVKEYIDAAKNRGWDAVQFNGFKNLKNEIEKRNIL